MDKLITAILFIGIPMALTQLIYRIIDHKGNKTAKLAERFPVLVKRKAEQWRSLSCSGLSRFCLTCLSRCFSLCAEL